MGDRSGIEWTDATWNPTSGCTKVSPGCKNCYAERLFPRVYGKARRFIDVRLHEERLDQPLRWRRPRRVFVNSMSDLFHESIPDEFITRVFAVMALAPRHQFQALTKRPERALDYLNVPARHNIVLGAAWEMLGHLPKYNHSAIHERPWPLPNVWLGVSVENQESANEPPADWRASLPADFHRAAGDETPHIIFLSAPCKGFSGLLSESRSKSDKYRALNELVRQQRVLQWAVSTFGPIAADRIERAARLVEEALELAQAEGLDFWYVHRIANRTFSRPAGDTAAEIGQVAIALEALAENAGCVVDAEAASEFERLLSMPKEHWAQRHAAKVAAGTAQP